MTRPIDRIILLQNELEESKGKATISTETDVIDVKYNRAHDKPPFKSKYFLKSDDLGEVRAERMEPHLSKDFMNMIPHEKNVADPVIVGYSLIIYTIDDIYKTAPVTEVRIKRGLFRRDKIFDEI